MLFRISIFVISILVIAGCSPNIATTTAPPPDATSEAAPVTDTAAPTSTATEEAAALPTETTPPTATSSDGANADVTHVRAVQASDGSWTFHVTVAHPDSGWEDYADGWDVVLPDGTVIKPDPDSPFTRLLLHPHENEQPFTRSQSNIVIPEGITEVTVRAHDLVDGFGGQEVLVDLTSASGENFEVEKQ